LVVNAKFSIETMISLSLISDSDDSIILVLVKSLFKV
jgi:hypothetical protein